MLRGRWFHSGTVQAKNDALTTCCKTTCFKSRENFFSILPKPKKVSKEGQSNWHKYKRRVVYPHFATRCTSSLLSGVNKVITNSMSSCSSSGTASSTDGFLSAVTGALNSVSLKSSASLWIPTSTISTEVVTIKWRIRKWFSP